MEKTRLERVIEETLRPVLGALEQMKWEIRETMSVTKAPWDVFKKPYNELTDEELAVLFDIYHTGGEPEPCPMCVWALRRELQEMGE